MPAWDTKPGWARRSFLGGKAIGPYLSGRFWRCIALLAFRTGRWGALRLRAASGHFQFCSAPECAGPQSLPLQSAREAYRPSWRPYKVLEKDTTVVVTASVD